MGKHAFLSPKAISNRIKSKGLQKLKWFCQMCQKQCRDENGFKCHLMSESHQRQLLLFAESPGKYMHDFSSEFKKCFLDILRRQFGTKRVKANVVYQEYIKDKMHVHMNSTTWYTLTGFVQHLGREGICRIDQPQEGKGWYIQYIDREEEERRERALKKQKMDRTDDELIQDLIQKQADRALQQKEGDPDLEEEKTKYTELQKTSEDEKVSFSLEKRMPKEPATLPPLPKQEAPKKRKSDTHDEPGTSKSKKKHHEDRPSSLKEIIKAEDDRKEKLNRRDDWLHENIIVKVITERLGDKFYKRKGVIESLHGDYGAEVRLLDGQEEVLKLDQDHLETVIPALGSRVLIVNGAYRGSKARLQSLDTEDFSVAVKIDEGPLKGRLLERVAYEDVCKVAE